ncbi:MAG: CBS domain-containing protein [Candidatus Levyibacteriota bacterium]
MKVKDVMYGSPIFIEENESLKKLAHLIFSSGVFGFPVVNKEEKVVGIVTQEDIFLKIHDSSGKRVPTNQLVSFLSQPVKSIMARDPLTVSPETDLVEAQLLMYKNSFAQLPVVDGKKLVGMITHSDVFRHVIQEEAPQLESNQYVSFVEENYDQMTDWDQRFDFEFPTLFRIFKRDNTQKILDLGVWTGEYTIGLAKEEVNVVGVDHNASLIAFANSKRNKLPEKIKKRISFIQSDYTDLEKKLPAGSFGGVICMGGALPYFPVAPEVVFKSAHNLLKKKGVFVLQLLNLERVMEHRKRFLYFRIKKSESSGQKEELYLEYFDQKDEDTLIQNIVTFVSDGKRWVYRGINSIDVKYIKNNQVEAMVRAAGFKDITITGNKGEEEGQYGHMSIVKPFDPLSSEWMTVIAYK